MTAHRQRETASNRVSRAICASHASSFRSLEGAIRAHSAGNPRTLVLQLICPLIGSVRRTGADARVSAFQPNRPVILKNVPNGTVSQSQQQSAERAEMKNSYTESRPL